MTSKALGALFDDATTTASKALGALFDDTTSTASKALGALFDDATTTASNALGALAVALRDILARGRSLGYWPAERLN